MLKTAFMGGADAFGPGPAALAAGGLEIAAYCAAPGRGALSLSGAVLHGSAWELFAEPGLQAAAISLPPAECFRAALLALSRGLHVFCEPPFCRSTGELEELREAAEKAGRVLFASQPWEHAPACRALEKAITRGLAGEVTFALARLELAWPGPADWTASPEAWQAASLLLGAVRRPPSAVEAFFQGFADRLAEDAVWDSIAAANAADVARAVVGLTRPRCQELAVKTVAIGATKRSALINLLRGDVLRTLAHNLQKECHLLIVG